MKRRSSPVSRVSQESGAGELEMKNRLRFLLPARLFRLLRLVSSLLKIRDEAIANRVCSD
jgi:hypothetical protein